MTQNETGPKLLAWWRDEYGQDWQFLKDGRWYGVRCRDESGWSYLGSWSDCS